MPTVLLALVGATLGGTAGLLLARRGVVAATAVERHQRAGYLIFAALVAVAVTLFFPQHLGWWMPVPLYVYGPPLLFPGVRLLAAFGVGLLVLLEWPGRRDRLRRQQLVVGSVVLSLAFAGTLYIDRPITSQLGEPRVRDDVVYQTTSYTCAPATIATLARLVLGDTMHTERSVHALTRTTRAGTSTAHELRAMRSLDLAPRFARGLTVDSLVALNRPALLHVDEPVAGRTIRHAVALLSIDPAARTVSIGNPLHGPQVKTFDELEGYWIGEAIFVMK